ncbi:MAG: DUF3237 domain-containing protein [Nitrolancea sp.]
MAIQPQLEHVYSATVELGAPVEMGATPHGYRVIVPILGGALEGPRISAKVLPGGADWITVRADGVSELDVRATARTHDGALIYVTIRGYMTNQAEVLSKLARGEAVPADSYYLGLAPIYETSDSRYAWLQESVAVGRGELLAGAVNYDVFAVK